MTYEEKVRWLRRYRDSLRLERTLREELAEQQSRACKITAALTGMPGGGGDGQALPREVVAVLNQVADARDHEILRRRYLLGQRFEEIAVEMCLEYRWVRRRHKMAVGAMTI